MLCLLKEAAARCSLKLQASRRKGLALYREIQDLADLGRAGLQMVTGSWNGLRKEERKTGKRLL